MAKKIVDAILSDEGGAKAVVGVGRNAAALKRKELIAKKSLYALGDDDKIQEALAWQEHSQVSLLDAVGGASSMVVPTSYSVGFLKLNPMPIQTTLVGEQEYIPHSHDVFNAPPSVIMSENFQADLRELIETSKTLRSDGKYIDLIGVDNVVVDDECRIRVIDTGLLRDKTLDSRVRGVSGKEAFSRRLKILESLWQAKTR